MKRPGRWRHGRAVAAAMTGRGMSTEVLSTLRSFQECASEALQASRGHFLGTKPLLEVEKGLAWQTGVVDSLSYTPERFVALYRSLTTQYKIIRYIGLRARFLLYRGHCPSPAAALISLQETVA